MKHIKAFENHNDDEINNEIIASAMIWIKANYTEDKVIELLDEEIMSGNWTNKWKMKE